jgi:hypothetical protein
MVKILLKYDRIRNFIYVLDIENIIASQHCNKKNASIAHLQVIEKRKEIMKWQFGINIIMS